MLATWLRLSQKQLSRAAQKFSKYDSHILGPSLVTGCSINKSLTNFYCNIFWTTSAAEFVGIIFRSLFQYITVAANFQKNLVCDTSYIEINAFFAIFNNKESENFKVRPSYSILKKWKSDCFKKYPLLKVPLLKK